MKWMPLVFSLLSAMTGVHGATSSNATAVQQAIASLSQCAILCVSEVASKVGCGALDIECQCASPTVQGLGTDCMLANCTVDESLHLSRVQADLCDLPHDSRNGTVWAIAITSAIIIWIMVILRVIARLKTVRKLWWDDWLHILAGIFAIPLNVFAFLMAARGFGNHIYDIDTRYAKDLLQYLYLCQAIWATTIFCVKLSILFLYLRIFKIPSKLFRAALYSVFGFTVVTYIVIVLMAALQCVPVRAVWDLDVRDAKCLNITNVAWSSAAVNIAAEVAILILPLPMLVPLQLSQRKKIGLYALFGAGIVVIAVAAARIPALKYLAIYTDPTWDNVPAYLWTCAETTVVNICAAGPAMRSLFTHARNKSYASRSYGDPTSKSGYSPSSALDGAASIPMTSSTITVKNSTVVEKAVGDFADIRALPARRPVSFVNASLSPDGTGFSSRGYTTTTITASAGTSPFTSTSPLPGSETELEQKASRKKSWRLSLRQSSARIRAPSPSLSESPLRNATPTPDPGSRGSLRDYESGNVSGDENVPTIVEHPPPPQPLLPPSSSSSSMTMKNSVVTTGSETGSASTAGGGGGAAAAAAAGDGKSDPNTTGGEEEVEGGDGDRKKGGINE